jgi:hypothetical protein
MEIEPRQRRSSRLNRKHPVSHSRKSSTSTEAKLPKESNHLHLQKSQSWKHSTVLSKVILIVMYHQYSVVEYLVLLFSLRIGNQSFIEKDMILIREN